MLEGPEHFRCWKARGKASKAEKSLQCFPTARCLFAASVIPKELLHFHLKSNQAPHALTRQLMLLRVNSPRSWHRPAGMALTDHGPMSHVRRDVASLGEPALSLACAVGFCLMYAINRNCWEGQGWMEWSWASNLLLKTRAWRAWAGDDPLHRGPCLDPGGCGASAAGLVLAIGAGGTIPCLQLSVHFRL